MERARRELEELQAPGSPRPPEPAPADLGNTKRSSGNKGPRPGSLAAAVACHRYLYDEGHDPNMKAAGLARQAAEYAAKLGLRDADLLNPESSTMQQMAQRFLEAHRQKVGQ